MTGAVVALAVALLAAVGGLVTFGALAIQGTRRAGSQQARGDVLAVRMEVAFANAKNESNRADAEKRRADALDAAIARLAAHLPIDGSYAQLLAEAADARTGAPGRGDAGLVRDAGAAGGPPGEVGPDDLLEPGA